VSDSNNSKDPQPSSSESALPQNHDEALMCLPLEAKPWFVAHLRRAGLVSIADDLEADDSKEWFGKHYVGILMMVHSFIGILKKVGVEVSMGPKPPEQGIMQPDKRLILPGQ
jgi:hypothetical protein